MKKSHKWTGVEVEFLRRELGMTQQELAYKVGCAMMNVSRWERGLHKPNRWMCRELDRLARRIGFFEGRP